MVIANKNSGKTPRNAGGKNYVLVPTPETVSAMMEARSIHLHRFISAKELFKSLDKAAQQNQVIKKLA